LVAPAGAGAAVGLVFLVWAQEFAQASLGTGLVAEFLVELPISGHQGWGALQDEGVFLVAIAFMGQGDNTCKCMDIILYCRERVIQAAGDLLGFEALEEQADGLNAMGLSGSHILLLAAGGDDQAASAQGQDIAHHRPETAVE
jgi:hypothetical protein